MPMSKITFTNLLIKDCSFCGGHHSIIFIELLTSKIIKDEEFTHAGVCYKKGGGLVYIKDNDSNNVCL